MAIHKLPAGLIPKRVHPRDELVLCIGDGAYGVRVLYPAIVNSGIALKEREGERRVGY